VVSKNENAALCSACGGGCCKTMPGGSSPEDWGAPDLALLRTRLKPALADGAWVVDRAGYVRPAVKNTDFSDRDRRWGTCVFLHDDGCAFPYELRPFGCRDFTPQAGWPYACYSACGQAHPDALAKLWEPYRGLLSELLESK
jgi:hypothetical protein